MDALDPLKRSILPSRGWAYLLVRTLSVALRGPLNERRPLTFPIDRPGGGSICRILLLRKGYRLRVALAGADASVFQVQHRRGSFRLREDDGCPWRNLTLGGGTLGGNASKR